MTPRHLTVASMEVAHEREGLPRMSEAELLAAHGGIPSDRHPAMSVREQHQRAVAAAIEEAEARLAARMGRV